VHDPLFEPTLAQCASYYAREPQITIINAEATRNGWPDGHKTYSIGPQSYVKAVLCYPGRMFGGDAETDRLQQVAYREQNKRSLLNRQAGLASGDSQKAAQ